MTGVRGSDPGPDGCLHWIVLEARAWKWLEVFVLALVVLFVVPTLPHYLVAGLGAIALGAFSTTAGVWLVWTTLRSWLADRTGKPGWIRDFASSLASGLIVAIVGVRAIIWGIEALLTL